MVNKAGKHRGLVRRSNWCVDFLQVACHVPRAVMRIWIHAGAPPPADASSTRSYSPYPIVLPLASGGIRSRTDSTTAPARLALLFCRDGWHEISSFRHLLELPTFSGYYRHLT